MKTFFNEVLDLLEDKQQMRLTIARTGDELTVMVVSQGKIINSSGTPDEMDEKLIPAIQQEVESKSFTFTVSEKEKTAKEKEEEEDADDEKEQAAIKVSRDHEKAGDGFTRSKKWAEALNEFKKSESAGHPSKTLPAKIKKVTGTIGEVVKKLTKEGDALLKKKKNADAKLKYEGAIERNKIIGVADSKLEDLWKNSNEVEIVVVNKGAEVGPSSINAKVPEVSEFNEHSTDPELFADMVPPDPEEKTEEVVGPTAEELKQAEMEAELAAKKEEFTKLKTAGVDFMKRRDFEEAGKSFRAALEIFPDEQSIIDLHKKVSVILEALMPASDDLLQ